MKRKFLLLIFILISCANEHNNQSEVQTTSDSLAAFNSFLTTNNLKAISLTIVSVYFLIQYSDIEAIHIINYCRANKILSHLNIGQISAGDLIFQDENKEISYNMQRSLSINDNGSLIVSKKYEETTIFLDKDSQNINDIDSVASHYDIINGKFVLSKKDSVEHGKKYFY